MCVSTPLDWSAGHVLLDVNVGGTSTVDVAVPPGVEVLVVRGLDGTIMRCVSPAS